MHCRVHAINPRIGEKKKTARHRAAPKEAPQIYRAPSPWWRSRYHSEWLLAMIASSAFDDEEDLVQSQGICQFKIFKIFKVFEVSSLFVYLQAHTCI